MKFQGAPPTRSTTYLPPAFSPALRPANASFIFTTVQAGGLTGRPSRSMNACMLLPVARVSLPRSTSYSSFSRRIGFSARIVTIESTSS